MTNIDENHDPLSVDALTSTLSNSGHSLDPEQLDRLLEREELAAREANALLRLRTEPIELDLETATIPDWLHHVCGRVGGALDRLTKDLERPTDWLAERAARAWGRLACFARLPVRDALSIFDRTVSGAATIHGAAPLARDSVETSPAGGARYAAARCAIEEEYDALLEDGD